MGSAHAHVKCVIISDFAAQLYASPLVCGLLLWNDVNVCMLTSFNGSSIANHVYHQVTIFSSKVCRSLVAEFGVWFIGARG